jgi:transposase InsO family protein
LSNTLDAGFCVDALDEALSKGCPEVFNTDQVTQFASEAFIGILEQHGIRIGMDGKGRYGDNLFIERLWWTVKYEEVFTSNIVESAYGAMVKSLISDPMGTAGPNLNLAPILS